MRYLPKLHKKSCACCAKRNIKRTRTRNSKLSWWNANKNGGISQHSCINTCKKLVWKVRSNSSSNIEIFYTNWNRFVRKSAANITRFCPTTMMKFARSKSFMTPKAMPTIIFPVLCSISPVKKTKTWRYRRLLTARAISPANN